MKWFTNKKKRLEMLRGIKPTSKATLKLQCLFCSNGDIDEAEKMYDFFAKDMPNLPDYDPEPQTWMNNTKDMANGILGWIGENKDTLAQGYEFIRAIVQNRSLPALTEPMPTGEALPPINGQ